MFLPIPALNSHCSTFAFSERFALLHFIDFPLKTSNTQMPFAMKRPLPLVILLLIAGICCIVTTYFCQFYYFRYRNARAAIDDFEIRINDFDARLSQLESHKSRQLTPIRVWAVISTTDKPLDKDIQFHLSSEKHPHDFFEAINAKGGPLIRPELRLPVGATTNCVYDIQVANQFGKVADAWLSHAEPYCDLAAFDEFQVYSPNRTNIVRLTARLKPGASVQMRFDVLLLCEE